MKQWRREAPPLEVPHDGMLWSRGWRWAADNLSTVGERVTAAREMPRTDTELP